MNPLVDKFCNLLMKSGKKNAAYAIFSKGFYIFLKSVTSNTSPSLQSVKRNQVLHKVLHTTSQHHKSPNTSSHNRKDCSALPPQTSCRQNNNVSREKAALPHKHVYGFTYPNNAVTPLGQHPLDILMLSVENCRPCVETRKVRVARTTYAVPTPISKTKGETLALRWIIEHANKRKEKDNCTLPEALAQELTNAYRKQGGPRQRRSELHKLAEANRSYIRYRWW